MERVDPTLRRKYAACVPQLNLEAAELGTRHDRRKLLPLLDRGQYVVCTVRYAFDVTVPHKYRKQMVRDLSEWMCGDQWKALIGRPVRWHALKLSAPRGALVFYACVSHIHSDVVSEKLLDKCLDLAVASGFRAGVFLCGSAIENGVL